MNKTYEIAFIDYKVKICINAYKYNINILKNTDINAFISIYSYAYSSIQKIIEKLLHAKH